MTVRFFRAYQRAMFAQAVRTGAKSVRGKRRSLVALLMAATLLPCLGGCKTAGTWLASRREPVPAEAALVAAEKETVAHLAPQQKADMHFALGRVAESRGETEQAVQAYRAALAEDHLRYDASWRLAVLLDRQGKADEAEKLFRAAIERAPDNADLRSDYGYSLSLQSRWSESEVQLRRVLQTQPRHARAHNNLGVVLAATGRPDEAWNEFEQAGCSMVTCHTNVAYGLALQNRLDDAYRHYEQALALDPKSATAQRGLQQVTSLLARAGDSTSPAAVNANRVPGAKVAVERASFIPRSAPTSSATSP